MYNKLYVYILYNPIMKNKQFEEKELAILRNAVDNIEKKTGYTLINNPSIKTIIEIVEQFLRDRKRICYGGTAINNILTTFLLLIR